MAIVDIVERDIPLRHKLDTVPCMIVMLRVEEYDYDNDYYEIIRQITADVIAEVI